MIILAESLTALIYLYLGLSLPWSSWQTLTGTLRELHFIAVFAAAIATAWGTARRRTWATKGAVALAAYAGLPNLASIGSFLQALGTDPPAPALLSLTLVVIVTVAQLLALVLALRQLQARQAAA